MFEFFSYFFILQFFVVVFLLLYRNKNYLEAYKVNKTTP